MSTFATFIRLTVFQDVFKMRSQVSQLRVQLDFSDEFKLAHI